MEKRFLTSIFLLGALASIGASATAAYAQVIGTSPTIIVHIPPSAYVQGNFHYDPPQISVPVGSTVGFANDDPGQVHTVTSGLPRSSDAGELFDSGVMNEGALFLHTFNEEGEYYYHCTLHPWMYATVTVSGVYMEGQDLRMKMGTGPVFDHARVDRTLLVFEPKSVTFLQDEPVTYNIIIFKNEEQVFSEDFSALGGRLPIELIPTDTKTRVYGPDSSDRVTGAYHIEGSFLKDNAAYRIRAEIVSAGGAPLDRQVGDDFTLQFVPEFPVTAIGAIAAVIGIVAVLGRARMFKTF